jgi:hypothetical protein
VNGSDEAEVEEGNVGNYPDGGRSGRKICGRHSQRRRSAVSRGLRWFTAAASGEACARLHCTRTGARAGGCGPWVSTVHGVIGL